MQPTSALRSTRSVALSAVKAYFEPITWLRKYISQPSETTHVRELTPQHLQVLFLSVVLMCGVFFTIGYVMGHTDYGGIVSASPFAAYKFLAKGQVMIEIAEVDRESDAIAVVRELQRMELPVVVVTPHSDSHYHVLVGPYVDAKSAAAAVNKLKANGYSTTLKY
jgi:hypothetical protein